MQTATHQSALEGELTPNLSNELNHLGFDAQTFRALRKKLADGVTVDDFNILREPIEPLRPESVAVYEDSAKLEKLGEQALSDNKVAVAILAGGMATRFGGVVKAAEEVFEGQDFLSLKLHDVCAMQRRLDCTIPSLLMASQATVNTLLALCKRYAPTMVPAEVFMQSLAPRLTPKGEWVCDQHGQPSLYATGHGDLPEALMRSGYHQRLYESGYRYLIVSNVDNVLASIDPRVLGIHIASGAEVTVELVAKNPGDKGGAPGIVHGRPQIIEGFRFTPEFDQSTLRWFNTNTFVFSLSALARRYPLSWFAVEKVVEGQTVIQFERLLGELTRFASTTFVEVPRDQRFLPIKTPQDLTLHSERLSAWFRERSSAQSD